MLSPDFEALVADSSITRVAFAGVISPDPAATAVRESEARQAGIDLVGDLETDFPRNMSEVRLGWYWLK